MWGDSISTVEAIQYCRGIAAVLRGDNISTCGRKASVLWRDSISTVEAVQYCGGIASVLWRDMMLHFQQLIFKWSEKRKQSISAHSTS